MNRQKIIVLGSLALIILALIITNVRNNRTLRKLKEAEATNEKIMDLLKDIPKAAPATPQAPTPQPTAQ